MRLRLLVLAFLLLVPTAVSAADAPYRLLAADGVVQAEGGDELRWPVAVAAASSTEIAAADVWGERLVVFSLRGGGFQFERTVKLPAPPRAVAYDGGRYVVALRGGKLVAVAAPGYQVRTITLPKGVLAATVAASADGGLWVHDAEAGAVLALSTDGKVRGTYKIEGRPQTLATSPDGGFYAAFVQGAEVRRYSRDGRLLATWKLAGEPPRPAWPSGLAVDGGEVLVVDRQASRILALSSSGEVVGVGSRRGWTAGELMAPAGIASLGDGRVVVADFGNGRLQVFRRLEKPR